MYPHTPAIPSGMCLPTLSPSSFAEFPHPPLPLKSYPRFKASSFTTYLPTPSSHQKKLLSLTSQGTYCLYQLVPNVCHLITCSINFSANKCLGLCLDCKFLKGRRENSSPSLYCGPPSQGALSIALYICENLVNILGINESMNKSISAAEGTWSEKTDDKKQE